MRARQDISGDRRRRRAPVGVFLCAALLIGAGAGRSQDLPVEAGAVPIQAPTPADSATAIEAVPGERAVQPADEAPSPSDSSAPGASASSENSPRPSDSAQADAPLADAPLADAPTGSEAGTEEPVADEPAADARTPHEATDVAPTEDAPTADDAAVAEAETETEAAEAATPDHGDVESAPDESESDETDEADKAAAQAILDAERTIADDAPAMPVAEDVDLSKPVVTDPPPPEPVPLRVVPEADDATSKAPLVLLGEEVAPGTSARLSWSLDQQFDGIAVPTPVLVVNGVNPGPTLCLTAALHGDELNGIEIVRRVLYDLDPKDLNGAVIGVPIVNLHGFRRGSRYLPDRRDLNRFFPGSETGSSASRIAHSFFTQIISLCDALVDIHTGSLMRTNLPQLRADMRVPEVAALTEGFGATAVLHSPGGKGTLRRAAVEAGIPAVTLETGEPSRLQKNEIRHGTKGIQTLLTKLDMTRRIRVWGDPEPVYYQSRWVRADQGGLLFGDVKLGQRVRKGQVLGTITDPITNVRTELRAPFNGRILGKALNQVVMPGFAAFRIGIQSSETELVQPGAEEDETENGNGDEAEPVPVADPADLDQEDENS